MVIYWGVTFIICADEHNQQHQPAWQHLQFWYIFVFMQLDPYDYEMNEVVLKVIERADEKITNININQV